MCEKQPTAVTSTTARATKSLKDASWIPGLSSSARFRPVIHYVVAITTVIAHCRLVQLAPDSSSRVTKRASRILQMVGLVMSSHRTCSYSQNRWSSFLNKSASIPHCASAAKFPFSDFYINFGGHLRIVPGIAENEWVRRWAPKDSANTNKNRLRQNLSYHLKL